MRPSHPLYIPGTRHYITPHRTGCSHTWEKFGPPRWTVWTSRGTHAAWAICTTEYLSGPFIGLSVWGPSAGGGTAWAICEAGHLRGRPFMHGSEGAKG
ncbi:hypothetical protein Pcinc_039968 [Petrolisthes cinctipes]|uniref:Uncharacterized protein n=1 Tax=Petrolisthes cinctipes TaxID=88211 RepID=A0AAE1EJ01_PETCI|nr:hypothetical protein Pcinc_039968 [Petrolisthes cinctipes]